MKQSWDCSVKDKWMDGQSWIYRKSKKKSTFLGKKNSDN